MKENISNVPLIIDKEGNDTLTEKVFQGLSNYRPKNKSRSSLSFRIETK